MGRTDRLLSFDTTRTAKKMTPPTVLRCRGNVFTDLLPLSEDTARTENDAANSSVVGCIRPRGT
jgi:hypothetical protein